MIRRVKYHKSVFLYFPPKNASFGDRVVRAYARREALLNNHFSCSVILALIVASAVCQGVGCQRVNPFGTNGGSAPPRATQAVSLNHTNDVSSPFHFRDVTSTSGVEWVYRNGAESQRFSIVESLGGGVAAFDYDHDGEDDLFFTGGGLYGPSSTLIGLRGGLFKNTSKFTFREVTCEASIDNAKHYSHGAFSGDYDNDGFPDLVVTGYGGLQFWCNQGDGTFVDRTEAAGLTDSLWSSAAAWADLNGDNIPDLYVAHYVDWSFENDPHCEGKTPAQRDICPPRQFKALPDILYFGQGDGTFVDGSAVAGLRSDGKGLGVVLADLDLDGDVDIYVTNDAVENFLYTNDGQGRFADSSLASGASLSDRGTPDGSMGLDLCDFNADGLPDLFVANYENENCALYENLGTMIFRHVSQQTGISASGGMYVGWGTLSNDLDLDGDEDLVVVNSHVLRFPENSSLTQPPLLYENLSRRRFANRAEQTGGFFAKSHMTRGMAGSDLNRDGAVDLITSSLNEPSAVLANVPGPDRRWLEIDVIGTTSSRDPVGARVTVTTQLGRQFRQFRGGGSYLSTHSRRLHWGLGSAESVAKIDIVWPGGYHQVVESPPINSILVIIEGSPVRTLAGADESL